MAVKVEAIPQVDTTVEVISVVLPECLEHANLYLRSIPVLLDGADDLDGNGLPCARVMGLNDPAKGSLTE